MISLALNRLNQETSETSGRFRKEKPKVSGAEGIERLSLDTSLTAKTSHMAIVTAHIEAATQ
jgi:hypothetical protein